MNLENEYTRYLLSWPKNISCVKLWAALELDNKAINRYLECERSPKDLFCEIEPFLNLEWGQLCVDDSVQLKEFSRESKADLVWKHWSGRYKKIVTWICLITLFYVDKNWARMPINWRVYDPSDDKSKNDYFIDMLVEVTSWWLKPSMVSGDSWYASWANLRFITKLWMGFCFSLKGNRLVRRKSHLDYEQVSILSIPSTWEVVHLKTVGIVKLFEHQWFIHAYRPPNQKKETARETAEKIEKIDFQVAHRNHWTVEEYHRVIKQVCHSEKHFFRKRNCVLSHLFFSLRAYCVLEINVMMWNLKNWYEHKSESMAMYTRESMKNMSLDWLMLV